MFFWYVLDEKFHEVQHGNRFHNIRVILVLVVMEGHVCAIVGINPGSGNDRAAEITADIFHYGIRIAETGLCINVESIFVFVVNGSLGFFERGTDAFFHFI